MKKGKGLPKPVSENLKSFNFVCHKSVRLVSQCKKENGNRVCRLTVCVKLGKEKCVEKRFARSNSRGEKRLCRNVKFLMVRRRHFHVRTSEGQKKKRGRGEKSTRRGGGSFSRRKTLVKRHEALRGKCRAKG